MTLVSPPDAAWKVSALHVYPVKSCGGVAVAAAQVTATGLKYDRLWMLLYEKTGRFVTQRQEPHMALIKVAIDEPGNRLVLSADSMADVLAVPLHPQAGDLGEQFAVRVWYDDVIGRCCGDSARAWLSAFIGKPVRLVYKDPDATRMVSRYVPSQDICPLPPQSSFADVFPFHITTQPSLAHVNKNVPRPLSQANFRPNVVLDNSAGAAYDEESWTLIEFSSESGDKDREPMKSLRKFRCSDPGKPSQVCFGMQAAPTTVGQTIHVGQAVAVRERGEHSLTQPL
ncbi:hypothetical protein DL89DRAFT_323854 [Linderina pennispora]|uniref:MOSC domain-containing protein n=1 Tax=Linderina pennispora TaxID=61395 RepID=A0A1Y1W530_9FUNG|nr:uncharacterized protein DL89DRAFT_323854 [Linderina pennispora]ORX68314.1 hypothetical protein DL89DRAFT_323854 [Linderina pennispora]